MFTTTDIVTDSMIIALPILLVREVQLGCLGDGERKDYGTDSHGLSFEIKGEHNSIVRFFGDLVS